MSRCKYLKQQRQVSYDNGTTWMNVVPEEFQRGDLYEPDSQDCNEGESLIRWRLVPGDFICEGKDKYQKEIEEYSVDNGVIWRSVYPTTYRKATLIEANSDICNNKWEGHYADEWYKPSGVCPKWYKWIDGVGCVYVDPVKIVRCSSTTSTTLTHSEVMYYTSTSSASWITKTRYELLNGIIGDCVTSIGNQAFDTCSALTEIVIPETVTSIGYSAFSACYSLSSVNLPSGLTSIGFDAFRSCSSITSATIPSGVTSIGNGAFYGCSSLTSITVEATTPPTLGGPSAFPGRYPIYVPCESLAAYATTYPWDYHQSRLKPIPPCSSPTSTYKLQSTYRDSSTHNVECVGMSVLTSGDTKPTGYTVSAMTSAIIGDCAIVIGDSAFSGCTSLSSVTMPNSVVAIDGYAFYHCDGLTTITIPSGVTSIGANAFAHCDSLTSIDLPDSVTSIGNYGFYNCVDLTDVSIGSGITSIGNNAFAYCYDLTGVTIYATTPPSIGNYVFNSTGYPLKIYVPADSVSAYKSAWSTYASNIYAMSNQRKLTAHYRNGTTYELNCESDTLTTSDTSPAGYSKYDMVSAEIGDCVTTMDASVFSSAAISSCTIGSGVTTIGTYAFNNCNYLTDIALPDSVTSIGNGIFYRCTGLTSVTIGSGLTGISESAFTECRGLTSVNLPVSITSIGSRSFGVCQSLSSITIPYGVTSIGDWVFAGCTALTGVTCLATTPPTLGSNAFTNTNNCPIYVPEGSVNTYKSASGWSSYASRIQPIAISGKAYFVYGDGKTYTANCDSDATLSKYDTKPSGYNEYDMRYAIVGSCVEVIGESAFSGFNSLKKVILPDTVVSFSKYSFNSIYTSFEMVLPYDGVVDLPIWEKHPLPSGGGAFITVKVPANRVQDYNNNSKWADYIRNGIVEIQAIN